MRHSATAILLVLLVCAGTGCRAPERRDHQELLESDPPLPVISSHNGEASGNSESPGGELPSASSNGARQANSTAAADDDGQQTTREAIQQLVAAGTISAAEERQLAEDLAQTDPALRGQVLDMLKASLAARESADKPRIAPEEQAEPRAPPPARVAKRPVSKPAARADQLASTDTPDAGAADEPRVSVPRKSSIAKAARASHTEPNKEQAAGQSDVQVAAAIEPTDEVAPEPTVRPALSQPSRVAKPVGVVAEEQPKAVSPQSDRQANQAAADAFKPAPDFALEPRHSTAKKLADKLARVDGSESQSGNAAKGTVNSDAGADAGDWQAHLETAIRQLSAQLDDKSHSAEDVSRQATLRILYLLDGKREEALRPIEGAPPAQQDFWSKQIFSLSSYLDTTRNPHPSRRAAEAVVHLREAAGKLGELATLSVRNLAFCSEVKSYGIYKKFEHYEFAAGQELLVYAEIENFTSKQTPSGNHTALKASYEILDTRGARVAEQEFPVTEEHCQNVRRDFFVRYFVTLPPNIYGGKYTLHLYVVDEHSQKMDHGSVEFTIKTKSQ